MKLPTLPRRHGGWLFGLGLLLASCAGSKPAYLFTTFRDNEAEGLRLLTSTDGYLWQDLNRTLLVPAVGAQKILRDPSIAQGPDGTYHLVWTSGWKDPRGFGYASSKDLLHWSAQRYIDVMGKEPTTVNVWAPEISYDPEQRHFVIVWASTVPFKFARGQEAEDNNHRLYYTTTTDFQTFAPTRLFLDPGFSAIDGVLVRRAKADYVLVVKDNTRPERNLKVAFAPAATGPFTPPSAPFTGKFTEGPTVARLPREWLIYYDDYENKHLGAVRTTDFKTFTDITGQISVPKGYKHGTILAVPAREVRRLRSVTASPTAVSHP